MRTTIKIITGMLVLVLIGVVTTTVGRHEKVTQKVVEQIDRLTVSTRDVYLLPKGYRAYDIVGNTPNGEIQNIGTYITTDTPEQFHVEYVTKKADPYFSDTEGNVDFDAIQLALRNEGKDPVMSMAGAFTPDNKVIQGFSLERGVSVGQEKINEGLNGLLLIENTVPKLHAVSELENREEFFSRAQINGASLFQQVSYIRPGGTFVSEKSDVFELRFFVEGSRNGLPSKGIIDLSVPFTYTRAVGLLTTLQGLTIERAIGLDTGFMSEAHIYGAGGNDHVLFEDALRFRNDERDFLPYRTLFTNVMVVY